MEAKSKKTIPKISIKIWKPVNKAFNEKIKKACLRRDAYLERILEYEVSRLDEEVSIPNSRAGYEYVSALLDKFDREIVSLALPSALTARLNETCRRKRIVRDAFFNRLFLLLAASRGDIDRLLFANADDDWRDEVWSEHRNEGPFFQNVFYPLEPDIDPFWAIRTGLEVYANKAELEDYVEPTSGETIQVKRLGLTRTAVPKDSLYTMIFDHKLRDKDLRGLSCYISDIYIPEHTSQREENAKLDKLFAELESQ